AGRRRPVAGRSLRGRPRVERPPRLPPARTGAFLNPPGGTAVTAFRLPPVSLPVALLLALAPSAARAEEPAAAPNVLVLIADDLGWHDVGYHGSDIKTPTLDRLAAAGVRLERHYVCPTCSPTRAGLLTGRNPSRFGIHGPIADRSTDSLPPRTHTLATTL